MNNIAPLSGPEIAHLHDACLSWYDRSARDLPWRRTEATPWHVMISEFMLQQTPVARVLPVYEAWVSAWPLPADLAREPVGEAIRAWGRLGYPRRAMRLHACARTIVERHDGEVPDALDDLRALPGVGEYTAAAVATFAHGRRHAVLDTNVRRVFARAVTGEQYPSRSLSVEERRLGDRLLPQQADVAARWSVAVMELGALCCTATSPACDRCPLRSQCAWRRSGYPEYDGPARRGQTYAGTDRQCRG
ncbi:MAG: A/G-specific adenine glycosylase, partial [Nocardioidaceae bacterium]